MPLFLLWIKYRIVLGLALQTLKPEMVLPPTFFRSASLPIRLFWYGWSARQSVHWIMPIIDSNFFTVGIITLFQAVLNNLGMIYSRFAASIFAGNALFRALVWSRFPTLCMLYLASTHIKALLIMAIIGKAAFSQVGNWPRQFPPGQYCTLLYTPFHISFTR